ncbi:MAG: autotransporter domain-containing protein [Rhodocyclaceae bacterium]|jgi:outer membrane lipase/esterase|nr:autotransporter domain-containing protein [Rhodocyclaceae bacterium]
MIRPRLLAVLTGLCTASLFAPHAAATQASAAVFFGDSLSDAGNFAPLLPPGTGRFTTNPGPVWSEVFAAGRGWDATAASIGGFNFATGGSRISEQPGFPANPPTALAPSLRQQIDSYLALNGGQARSNALHSVWAGANDIFFIANSNPAQGPAYIQQTAAEAVTEIARLSAAGARHIMVFNLPDIGSTPFGQAQGPTAAVGLSALASGYNQLLFAGLAAEGIEVIALDAFGLLGEVQNSPLHYGFLNATAPACGSTPSLLCTQADFVAPDADQDFVFADGVHPGTAAHALLAQYVEGVLGSAHYIGQLPELAVLNQRALSRQLWRSAQIGMSTTQVGQSSAWASAGGGNAGIAQADGSALNLSVGVERRLSEQLLGGAALSFSRMKPDWGTAGDYRLNDRSLSLYGAWRADALSVSAALSYADLSYRSNRQIQLGAATRSLRGDTDGSRLAAGLELAYALEQGSLRHGPLASLLWQRVKVDGFDEHATDGSRSSNLTHTSQKRESTVVSAGWQAMLHAGRWTPYGSVLLNHDFDAGTRTLRMRGTASDAFFGLSTSATPDTYVSLNAGALWHIGQQAMLDINIDAQPRRKGMEDTRVTVGLRMPF